MPGFDRTGPAGLGPRTGRGLGACPSKKGKRTPLGGFSTVLSPVLGRGRGRGLGRRRRLGQ